MYPMDGRLISKDTYEGQIDNPLSLNLYTYVQNNPLTFVDPNGHIPTPMESAEMADHIYGATNKDYGKSVSGGTWALNYIITKLNAGLKIGVYFKVKKDGTLEYAVVNKGTTPSSKGDWANNFQQPSG